MSTKEAPADIVERFERIVSAALYSSAMVEQADIEAVRAALSERAPERAVALADMEARKDAAYLERNQCVALIARMALALGRKSGIARTAIEGWSDDWHGCVYIDLPTGQASWHFHDSQSHLFAGLPAYDGAWDGHDTPTKYERVAEAYTHPAPERAAPDIGENDTLTPFDAVARAMDAASLLAGAVAMNDTDKADAYAARLRAHLIRYIYPAAAQPAAAVPAHPTDPLHDDAYLRAVALGFPQGDARRWTLCRIADRVEAALTPQPAAAPESAERQAGPNAAMNGGPSGVTSNLGGRGPSVR